MRRTVCCLLVLAAAARSQGLELADLFDAGRREFPLRPYAEGRFVRLKPKDRLVARGLNPALWKAPPAEPDSVLQDNHVRARLYPGFEYRSRLQAKQRVFDRLVRRVSVHELIGLLAQIESRPLMKFVESVGHLAIDPRSKSRLPLQPLNALRHSERQFQRWFLDELARRVNQLKPRARGEASWRLQRELFQRGAAHRRRIARVLGGIDDPIATAALERWVFKERDPDVVGALMHARARIGGERFKSLLVLWAPHPEVAVRTAAIRACRTIGGEWGRAMLKDRVSDEPGRLRGDILTGLGGAPDGGTDFYGIRTNSRRVLFLVDTSGSMAFPVDGKGGKLEPRVWRTKREISRTLKAMPKTTRFNVMLFAQAVVPWKRKLVSPSAANVGAALAFLEHHAPEGGTNLHAGLEAALASDADTVFLLTDGEPSVGLLVDPALILEEVAERNPHGRVVIHAVGLSRDQNAELLVNLAHRNGGRYVADR